MIRRLEVGDIDTVSLLHKKELPGFLSELGVPFLRVYYEASLLVPSVFTFVFEDDTKVVGVATGVESSKGLLSVILFKFPFRFFYIFLIYIITHPQNLLKFFRVLTYPGVSENHAELLTIAVSKQYQKKRIGRQLLSAVIEEFARRRVQRFLVSIYDRMPANSFYKRMGFTYTKSFDFLGERMNYYRYILR